MRVYLVLKCEDGFVAKARYVFSTFCKVLGLDLVENGRGSSLADGPTVWYGAPADVPRAGPRLICIHASQEAAVFFASHNPLGVVRQILMALIVWGLLVIANQDSGKLSPKQLWRQLQADIHRALLELGYRLGFKGAMSLLVE